MEEWRRKVSKLPIDEEVEFIEVEDDFDLDDDSSLEGEDEEWSDWELDLLDD